MTLLLLIGAALLGLAVTFGPEVRVCLRHRRARRSYRIAARRPK